MARWTPRLASSVDYSTLQLTAEEGFVLSRVDGATNVDNLVHLAGMPREQLDGVLENLVRQGVIEPPPPEPAPAPSISAPVEEAEPPPAPAPEEPPPDAPAEEEEPEAKEDPVQTGTYRKLFETELHPLDKDERMARAKTATGAVLLAFCFDPDPGVIKVVLEHTETGLEHARLIAAHHRNPVGLEALGHRSEFLRDGQVQRMLLRNVQLPDGLFKLMMNSKPLQQVYTLTIDRNVPERTTQRARNLLRTRFSSAQPEERANIIFSTEGRVLQGISGIPLDSKTTQLLCARAWNNTLLIQNACRFPGAPPPLLLHIAKQPAVKRQPHLRQLLLQHPNAPSEVKRILAG